MYKQYNKGKRAFSRKIRKLKYNKAYLKYMSRNLLETIKQEIEKTQVLIFAGGKGKRMGFIDKPKPLIEINGKPLLDLCIEFFKNCGYKNFILLLGYKHQQIIQYIENRNYQVNIKYSIDPPVKKVGRAKALKHAIDTGIVDEKTRSITAYPDDIFLDKTLPIKLLLHHLEGVQRYKTKATIVLTKAITYPYGAAQINENNLITDFIEKPTIKIPTATGLQALEPQILQQIKETININEDRVINIEQEILPKLAKQKQLYALTIPANTWIPINTLKELEKAISMLNSESIYN